MGAMYRLIYQYGEAPQTYSFESGEVVIGRSPDCQIELRDNSISRKHAKVVVDDGGVRILDLKSKNGIKVNDVPVEEAKPLSEEAGTIIRSVGELSRLLEEAPAPTPADARKAPPVDVQEIEKSNRILKVLTKVAETLIAVRPVEEVLHQVMDIVFEHMPADRGFLMLEDEARANKLVPMVG